MAVGESLETQDARGQTLGVVKVGLVKGMRRGVADKDKTIILMGKGRLIGFSQPFGQSALLNLVTISPTRVCEVDMEAAREIAMPYPPFQEAILRTIHDFLGSMADWSQLLREESFLTKVCGALHMIAAEGDSPSFRIPSHTELANVLGARRETIARHIAILIERGLFQKVDRWHGMLTTTACDKQRV